MVLGSNDSLLDDYNQDRRSELLGWNSPVSRHILSLIPRSILESPDEELHSGIDQGYQSPKLNKDSFRYYKSDKTPLLHVPSVSDRSAISPDGDMPSVCLDTPNDTYTKRPGLKFDVQTLIGYTSYHVYDPCLAVKILLSPIKSACLRCMKDFTSPFNSKQNERQTQKLRDLLLILCVSIEDFRDTYGLLPSHCYSDRKTQPVQSLTNTRYLPPIEREDLLGFLLVDKLNQNSLTIEDQSEIDFIISVFQYAMTDTKSNENDVTKLENSVEKGYLKLTPTIPGGSQRTYNFLKDVHEMHLLGNEPILSFPISSSEDELSQIASTRNVESIASDDSKQPRKSKRKSGRLIKQKNPEDNVRYKTELCSHFARIGCCPKGPSCHFAHGTQELRVVSNHGKYRTRYCKNQDSCPFKDKCAFIHRKS